ncbi:MAG: FMN-binding negative transcriptional regulator [Bdellovibrionales bacterium]|nr:FMN-binding negative transcriptional regulator [Bdellovibrionales bacterium]
MKNYPMYLQTDHNEIKRFIEGHSMCTVSTGVHNGVFNPVYIEGDFYFHLNRTDEQFKEVIENKKGTLIFFEFLCNIPSYWVDPLDGGVATSYYRYAEFTCQAEVYTEREDLAKLLPIFLEKYQSEGGYEKLTLDSSMYQSDYKVLGIVKFTPYRTLAKWKIGQNRPIEKRQEIISKLQERNHGLDHKACEEIQRWITLFQK